MTNNSLVIMNQWRPTAESIPIITITMALAHLWLGLRFGFGSALALDQLWLWISFGFGFSLALALAQDLLLFSIGFGLAVPLVLAQP